MKFREFVSLLTKKSQVIFNVPLSFQSFVRNGQLISHEKYQLWKKKNFEFSIFDKI